MNGDIVTVDNYISGKYVAPTSGKYLAVYNPANDSQIGSVGVSSASDVETAVAAAEAAFPAWSSLTIKARATIVSHNTTTMQQNSVAKKANSHILLPHFLR